MCPDLRLCEIPLKVQRVSDAPGCRVTVGGDARDKFVLCSNRIRNVSLLTPVTLVLSVNVTDPAEPALTAGSGDTDGGEPVLGARDGDGDAEDAAGTVTPPTVMLVTLDSLTCRAAAS